MIAVPYLNFLGTHSRRTHHDIKALGYGIFRHRDKNLREICAETVEIEGRDVVLARGGDAGGIGPVGIHVETDEIHLPPGIKELVDFLLVVLQATVDIIVSPLGSAFIEPRTIGLSEAMEIDHVAVLIREITAVDM